MGLSLLFALVFVLFFCVNFVLLFAASPLRLECPNSRLLITRRFLVLVHVRYLSFL